MELRRDMLKNTFKYSYSDASLEIITFKQFSTDLHPDGTSQGHAEMRARPERQPRGAEVHRDHPAEPTQLPARVVPGSGEAAVDAPVRVQGGAEDTGALQQRADGTGARRIA